MNVISEYKKKLAYQIFFAHHPACEKYKNHVFQIGKFDFCIGCYIGFPMGILAVILAVIFHTSKIINLNSLLYIGLIMSSSILWKFFTFAEIKRIKIIQKILIGFGGGLLLTYVYFSTIGSVIFKFFEVWGMFVILMTPLTIFHYNHMKKMCSNCKQEYKENICPFKKSEKSFSNDKN